MQLIQAPRASAILYSILLRRTNRRPWLLPANICPIVPIIFLKAQMPFGFVDISASTLHMDLEQAEGRIKTRKFGGMLYAHTYGDPSTPRDFFVSLKNLDPELVIVDDRCLCIPDFEPVSPADVILYSTGYAKIVELNFGGYAFIHDDLDYQPAHLPFLPSDYQELEKQYKEAVVSHSVFSYRDSDWLNTDAPVPAWYDYRQQVEGKLKSSLERRVALNQVYGSGLPQAIQLPEPYQTWRFNIRVKDKVRILNAIFQAGLFASSHYASLAAIMAEGRAPQAEALADEVVNLFNDHHFDEKKANQTCEIILEHL